MWALIAQPMNKKILISTLLLSSVLFFVGCSKYQVAKPNLNPEWVEEYKTTIQEGKTALEEEGITEEEKIQTFQDMAVAYNRLGNYAKAIDYYEKVLALHPTDYLSLNNMVAIYEEVEEYEKAIPYARTLYTDNSENQEVVRDAIRVHLQIKDTTNAQLILNDYASKYQSDETSPFINEQYEYIQRVTESLK